VKRDHAKAQAVYQFALSVTISSRYGTQFSMLVIQIPYDGEDAAVFLDCCM
jgi:hypothetical protein